MKHSAPRRPDPVLYRRQRPAIGPGHPCPSLRLLTRYRPIRELVRTGHRHIDETIDACLDKPVYAVRRGYTSGYSLCLLSRHVRKCGGYPLRQRPRLPSHPNGVSGAIGGLIPHPHFSKPWPYFLGFEVRLMAREACDCLTQRLGRKWFGQNLKAEFTDGIEPFGIAGH